MVKPRVYKALLEWERKKNLDNFRRVYRECFTGGIFIWRTCMKTVLTFSQHCAIIKLSKERNEE